MRRVKEGTSAVLQSGLDEKWSADSMERCCYLRNIQDKLSDGKTSYERRSRMPFNGPVIPFGAMVDCHPISAKDQSGLHQFGSKVLPGIPRLCIACGGASGKETLWSQTLKNWRIWTHLKFMPEGSMQKEVLTSMIGETYFPDRRWNN